MRVIFFLILGCISMNVFAQGQYLQELGARYRLPNSSGAEGTYYEGSPYLDEEFIPAKVEGFEKTQLVRFNAYEGKVELKLPGNKVYVLPESKSQSIVLLGENRRTYITDNFTDSKGDKVHGFLELMHSGESFELYVRESIRFFKKIEAEGYQKEVPPRFKKGKDAYYLKTVDTDGYMLIPSKQKAFLKLFPASEVKNIKNEIKSKDLSITDKEDLIKLFTLHWIAP